MFSIWKSAEYKRDTKPLYWVETIEEVAAVVGDRVEWLSEQLAHRSYLRTRGWHIEPNT